MLQIVFFLCFLRRKRRLCCLHLKLYYLLANISSLVSSGCQMLIGSHIWTALAMLMVERPGGLFEGHQIWFVNVSTYSISKILTLGIQNERSKQIKEYRVQEKPGKNCSHSLSEHILLGSPRKSTCKPSSSSTLLS